MHVCCRCNGAAGFWVMAKNAKVVRRPWCLSCATAFLDPDDVTMTRIETPPAQRLSVRVIADPRGHTV
jgi:hypothetical protein